MSDGPGYIYRIARADEQQLRELIKAHVGANGRTFGGAAQWDLDLSLEDKRKNLREITPIDDAETVCVRGDFGHAFSPDAEVRWKRRDDGAYDVLVLSEDELQINGATPLRTRHWNNQTQAWEDGDWTIRSPEVAAIRQTAGRPPIAYIDYIAPNGAVQFQRLVRVEP